MTVSLKHLFTSAKSDGSDPTQVQPSNWNAEHVLTAGANTVIARASASSGAVSDVALSASQLLGRGDSGNVTAITLGSGLTMTGDTLSTSGSGSGDALKSGTLAQFAATTSAELAGVISDETGMGALVFANSPTLVTPTLGTPASGTLTNCTGLPTAGLNNDAVTYAKIQNASANVVLTRAASSSGDVGETALSASQLLGRGSTGDIAAITLGTGLSMSGATLNASGTGDVTAASSFGTDNRVIRSDGTGKGVQSTGITVADTTDNVSGVGDIIPKSNETQNLGLPTGFGNAWGSVCTNQLRVVDAGNSTDIQIADQFIRQNGLTQITFDSVLSEAVLFNHGIDLEGLKTLKFLGTPSMTLKNTSGQLDIDGGVVDFGSTPTVNGTALSTAAAIQFKDEGSNIGTSGGVTAVNFTGAGVTATHSSGTVTVDITSGGGLTLGTVQNTTSGTSIDFTGIPSGVKQINVMFDGVSTNGTSIPIIQIGDSGGIETTGYLTTTNNLSAAVATTNYTNGWNFFNTTWAASVVVHGTLTLTLLDSSTNTWTAIGILSRSDTAGALLMSGSKSLSATLDRVRLTTAGGANTFDAGKMNISYM